MKELFWRVLVAFGLAVGILASAAWFVDSKDKERIVAIDKKNAAALDRWESENARIVERNKRRESSARAEHKAAVARVMFVRAVAAELRCIAQRTCSSEDRTEWAFASDLHVAFADASSMYRRTVALSRLRQPGEMYAFDPDAGASQPFYVEERMLNLVTVEQAFEISTGKVSEPAVPEFALPEAELLNETRPAQFVPDLLLKPWVDRLAMHEIVAAYWFMASLLALFLCLAYYEVRTHDRMPMFFGRSTLRLAHSDDRGWNAGILFLLLPFTTLEFVIRWTSYVVHDAVLLLPMLFSRRARLRTYWWMNVWRWRAIRARVHHARIVELQGHLSRVEAELSTMSNAISDDRKALSDRAGRLRTLIRELEQADPAIDPAAADAVDQRERRAVLLERVDAAMDRARHAQDAYAEASADA